MHLYLIRHGEKIGKKRDVADKLFEVGLTDLGHSQSKAFASWLRRHTPTVHAIYSSTLARAHSTASYLSQTYQIPVVEDNRLRESGYNRFDHSRSLVDDLPARVPWSSVDRPFKSLSTREKQESWMHCRVKIGRFFDELKDRDLEERVIVVCHGWIINAFFDNILNIGAYRRCYFASRNGGITYFEYRDNSPREPWIVHNFNRTDHIS